MYRESSLKTSKVVGFVPPLEFVSLVIDVATSIRFKDNNGERDVERFTPSTIVPLFRLCTTRKQHDDFLYSSAGNLDQSLCNEKRDRERRIDIPFHHKFSMTTSIPSTCV